jgi:Flp pilus assembly protein TadB
VRRLRTQEDRDWAAATLQIVLPSVRRTPISLAIQEASGRELSEVMRDLLAELHEKLQVKS